MSRKSGITLLELLTVVTIVSLLLAILTPVMSQAREAARKTAALSNMKQTAGSIVLYVADFDDTFPLSGPVDYGPITGTPGAYLFGWVAGFPNGWDGSEFEFSDSVAWPNSTSNYRASDDVAYASDLPTVRLSHFMEGSPYDRPLKRPNLASFTFNGLLHSWNATAIAQPSELTLIWQGAYKAAVSGYAYANPVLYCNANSAAPCRFNPAGFPQAGAFNEARRGDAVYSPYGPNTAWIYGRGMNFVSADTSASWRPQNPSGQTADMVRSYRDPAGLYGPNGKQLSFHRCLMGEGTMVRYTSFFRPDSEFRYEFGATQATRCDP